MNFGSDVWIGGRMGVMETGNLQIKAFLGRQPIFDRDLNVWAYELLFRSDDIDNASLSNGDVETAQVLISTVTDFGIDAISGGRPLFINLSHGFLSGKLPIPLSRDQVVLEVLEDIPPDEAVMDTLRAFADRGYTIALDDFVYTPRMTPLMEVAHIVKLDILALTPEQLDAHIKLAGDFSLKLLAEKVETYEQYDRCRDLGFEYFQGFFLSHPLVLMEGGGAQASNRMVILRLLARLQDPNAQVSEIETLIAQDVTLTYRLMKCVNSAYVGLRHHVESLRRALLILGLRTIRDWASLILLTRISDKSSELMTIALVRARMNELLAPYLRLEKERAFTVGLFSILDAILDRPMEELLKDLPFDEAI